MTLVLVQHAISGQIVELDEVHLAHPVLGPHYRRVRVNANGKVYILKPGESAVEDEIEEVEETAPDGKDEK